MGMISGTAVANVLTTGTISIPLMRRGGYRPAVAGAVEAVASTGTINATNHGCRGLPHG